MLKSLNYNALCWHGKMPRKNGHKDWIRKIKWSNTKKHKTVELRTTIELPCTVRAYRLTEVKMLQSALWKYQARYCNSVEQLNAVVCWSLEIIPDHIHQRKKKNNWCRKKELRDSIFRIQGCKICPLPIVKTNGRKIHNCCPWEVS